MVAFKNIENVKALFSLLDHYSLTGYLEGETSPFESEGLTDTVRKDGYIPAAKKLLRTINSNHQDVKKIISAFCNNDPDLCPDDTEVKASDIYKTVLNKPKSSDDLKKALEKTDALPVPPQTKKALNDLLRLLDYLDVENAFADGGNLPEKFRSSYKNKGCLPTIKELFAALETEDRNALSYTFELTGVVTPKMLMIKILDKSEDDSDLRSALCRIDPNECIDDGVFKFSGIIADPRVMCAPVKETKGSDKKEVDLRGNLASVDCKLYEKTTHILSAHDRIKYLISLQAEAMGKVYSNTFKEDPGKIKFSVKIQVSPDVMASPSPLLKNPPESVMILWVSHSYLGRTKTDERINRFIDDVLKIIKKVDYRYADFKTPMIVTNEFEF